MTTMKNRAFTLVELVIVIAIIGVMALILIPTFKGFVETSHNSIIEIYNNVNNQDSEIIVKDSETKEIIYQGKTSEWQEKINYELVNFERSGDVLILYVKGVENE